MYAASASRLNYLITNILHGIHCKLLAIIRLGYFLFLSFIYRIFHAFADDFKSFVPHLFPKNRARDKLLSLNANYSESISNWTASQIFTVITDFSFSYSKILIELYDITYNYSNYNWWYYIPQKVVSISLFLPFLYNNIPVNNSFFMTSPHIPEIRIIRLGTLFFWQKSHSNQNWQFRSPSQ